MSFAIGVKIPPLSFRKCDITYGQERNGNNIRIVRRNRQATADLRSACTCSLRKQIGRRRSARRQTVDDSADDRKAARRSDETQACDSRSHARRNHRSRQSQGQTCRQAHYEAFTSCHAKGDGAPMLAIFAERERPRLADCLSIFTFVPLARILRGESHSTPTRVCKLV